MKMKKTAFQQWLKIGRKVPFECKNNPAVYNREFYAKPCLERGGMG